MLEIKLFGGFGLKVDGAAYRFVAPPRTTQLLAYLVLHRGSTVARDQLAYTLFTDQTEPEALANLRRHLYYLDRALAGAGGSSAYVRADAKRLEWIPAAPVRSDVEEFVERAARGDLAGAVNAYSGDLLDGIDEEWLLADRERFRDQYAAHVIALIDEMRREGNLQASLDYAQRLLEHDPWREDAVREIMLLRFERGDGAGALSTYLRFAKRLADELNAHPMPETAACYEAIAAADSPSAARSARLDAIVHGADGMPAREALEAAMRAIQTRKGREGDLSLDWLKPFMTPRRCRSGTTLFRRGEVGTDVFYVVSGTVAFVEFGGTAAAGELFGEIALFAPDRRRTATARCDTDVELLTIGEDALLDLSYKIPEFGVYLLALVTKRLLRDVARAEARRDVAGESG